MEKRDTITSLLVLIIVSSIVVAGMLTIQNYQTIIDDLNNTDFFPSNPLGNDNKIDEQGFLNLFFISSIAENNVKLTFNSFGPPNDTESLENVWLNITGIELIGNNSKGNRILEERIMIDLLSSTENAVLLDTFNVTVGSYPAIKVFFENYLVVNILEIGKEVYTIQGTSFLVISFMQNRNSENKSELEIAKNSTKHAFLDFGINLNSITQIATVTIHAFLTL